MRKKLLALLMCATMVLGTGVSAMAATPSSDDYANAATVLKAYTSKNISNELDAKSAVASFPTTYQTTNGNTVVTYVWGFTNEGTTAVKLDPSDTQYYWTKVDNTDDNQTLDTLSDENGFIISNASVKTSSVVKSGAGQLYYVSKVEEKAVAAGEKITLATNQYLWGYKSDANSTNAYFSTNGDTIYTKVAATGTAANPYNGTTTKVGDYSFAVATTVKLVTLTPFASAETGTVVYDSASRTNTTDTYGVDPDGYIALRANSTKISFKPYTNIADGYLVQVSSAANSSALQNVAQALADGTISKNAAAVKLTFYKLTPSAAQTKSYTSGSTVTATQSYFYDLATINFDANENAVTFKTDWLSRTNVKNANVVYLVDPYTTSYLNYYTRVNTVWKVSDLADEQFSTKYVTSGVYIFDYVEPESQNDGVSDTDTTTTTTAATAATSAETAASSPKTGDVAPIAALAVVMMGACGAMVVASKKRA